MTQEDLAEALNVSKRSLQDYEAGVTIPWKHFQRLEQIFGYPLGWFIHGDEDPPKPAEAWQVRMEEQLAAMHADLRRLLEDAPDHAPRD